ncbi:universal stress protein [Saprospiraceae bacterium]|nr:universal stress protein [bacterium]MDC3219794.1 universal stress protein [Saprospiraceae bacterium]
MQNKLKILVPTDFSFSAENAFRHAILMADQMKADISLIHVVNPDLAVIDVPVAIEIAMTEKMKIANQKLFELTSRILSQTVQQIKNVPVILTKIEMGNPEAVINQFAKEHEYDFICIGTRDEHGAIDKILGSVAANVIKKAPCPVFVIPEYAAYRKTTLVTYATNFIETDPYEIWRVSKLLEPFHPIIRCVHFTEFEEKQNTSLNMEKLKTFFSENAPALQITFHEIATENKLDSMLEFLNTFETNLLVTYQPHRNYWQRLIHRSFTKKMALESKTLILVLRGK